MVEQTNEVIVAAACRVGEHLFLGVRHWDPAMSAHYKALKQSGVQLDMNSQEEGFYTNRYRFIDRVEGLALAKENGQFKYPLRNGADDELYSEGLW